MSNVILTSSFSTVGRGLREKGLLPEKGSIVAFIPTAGDPYAEKPWMEADRLALVDLGYGVFDVDLKNKNAELLRDELAAADVIFVAGGNTTYLVAQAHLSGFDVIVRDLLRQGKVYIGSSAGSILAGPSVEPFIEGDLPELSKDFVIADPSGLGLVDYIVLPHYPTSAKANDAIAERYDGQFRFVEMTDQAFSIENVTELV